MRAYVGLDAHTTFFMWDEKDLEALGPYSYLETQEVPEDLVSRYNKCMEEYNVIQNELRKLYFNLNPKNV